MAERPSATFEGSAIPRGNAVADRWESAQLAGGRGPHLTLIGSVDDATGTVPFALFRQQEDAHGYMLMLREIIARHGIPMALYSDRHSIFQNSTRGTESLEEQLRGDVTPRSSPGRWRSWALGYPAHTPQAKGRVERAWDTFQDRLVSEMRLAGTATIEQANRMLLDFLPRYNRRFGVAPAQPGSAYRQPAPGVSLDAALCFKYLRTVANDNTIHFNGAALQVLPDGLRASYARVRVEVQVRLDGSILVFHQGRSVASAPAPLEPVTLRAQKGPRYNGLLLADTPTPSDNGNHDTLTTTPLTPKKTRDQNTTKPSPNHPWRRPLLT